MSADLPPVDSTVRVRDEGVGTVLMWRRFHPFACDCPVAWIDYGGGVDGEWVAADEIEAVTP